MAPVGADQRLTPVTLPLPAVINFGGDEHNKYVLATSWGRFLEDFADELEAGNFAIGKHKYGTCSAMSGSWARGNWPRRFRSRLDYRS
jgi:hypothetical protein